MPHLSLRVHRGFSLHLLVLHSILVLGDDSSGPYSSSQQQHCKSVPGTASWPSPVAWKQLNASTGGRLLQPLPPGAVCHPGQPTYNAAECPAIQEAWLNQSFHQANPISSMWNNFNNDSCLPVSVDPCSGEGYPAYVINATTAKHVQLGVNFARQYSVRLIVKSTGHDYLGRSSAPSSLSLWTHFMKDMAYRESFASSCDVGYHGPIATFGAGAQMGDAYEFMDSYNQTIVGGGARSVSMGGYITGGGHSLLSPRYGLAADQVLEMEVVTPAGDIQTINACNNPDLFWAMRGGGGSTFAVMTSVTLKTYPTPKLTVMTIGIYTLADPETADAALDAITYMLSQFPYLSDSGVSGYPSIGVAVPNPIDNTTLVTGLAGTVALQDVEDPNAMLAIWEPILEHVNQTWPGLFVIATQMATFPSLWTWFQTDYDTTNVGGDVYLGSRLLDGPSLTANLTASKKAISQFMTSSNYCQVNLVSGKGVWNSQPSGGSNAVLPAWRKAYVHAIVPFVFEPLNQTAKAEASSKIRYMVQGLRNLAPNSGAYMNEANPQEPDWQHQFWGINYSRLVTIKRAVDPEDVLWCTPCVGNERWTEVGDQLCRV